MSLAVNVTQRLSHLKCRISQLMELFVRLMQDLVNTLDRCYMIEKAINFIILRENSDVLVSIKKKQKSRFWYTKYVWCGRGPSKARGLCVL